MFLYLYCVSVNMAHPCICSICLYLQVMSLFTAGFREFRYLQCVSVIAGRFCIWLFLICICILFRHSWLFYCCFHLCSTFRSMTCKIEWLNRSFEHELQNDPLVRFEAFLSTVINRRTYFVCSLQNCLKIMMFYDLGTKHTWSGLG